MARVPRALFTERTARLREELLRTIAQEPYTTGTCPLPAEAELGRRSKLSRQSVRLVLDGLAREGLVVRRAHRGVFARVGGPADPGNREWADAGRRRAATAVDPRRDPDHAIAEGQAPPKDDGLATPGADRSLPLLPRRQPVTLRLAVFEQGGQLERLRKLIALYRLVEPAADVQLVELRVSEYGATLAELWRHGMATDLALLATHHLADVPALAPAMFAEQDSAVMAAVPTAVRRSWEVGGALVAAPFLHSPVATAVNLDLLAAASLPSPEPDWTWDDFREAAQATMERLKPTRGGDVWGTVVTGSLNRWPMHVLQAGGAFVSPDGRQPLFETAPFAEALSFSLDLLHTHRVAPVFALGREDVGSLAGQMFARGQVGALDVSSMALDQLAPLPFRWQVLPPPQQVRSANLLLVTGIAIGRGSPHDRACRDFLQYLLSPPVQEFLRLDSYSVPATVTPKHQGHEEGQRGAAPPLAAGTAAGFPPARTALRELLPEAHPFTLAESVALRAAAGTLEMALAGAISPALAIQQMQQAATAALAVLPPRTAGEPAVA
jgi:ABC-type glycerol-3-phosphate transport system substrate-binding protein